MASSAMELVKEWKCFGGVVRRYKHHSTSLGGLPATFQIFLPSDALGDGASKVPAIIFLSGLTCTDENFMTKAGAQQYAAQHGIALIAPDTSPRGANLGPEETAAYDFGAGAGFYVNATQEPWSRHYRMYDYVTSELPGLLSGSLPINTSRMAIMGHSMGGHGALQIALKNPALFRSVSAFSPICHPSACPWGIKAFSGYLGADNKDAWAQYDSTALVASYKGPDLHILVDQGSADDFLASGQLLPEKFLEAAKAAGVPVAFKLREGYDHSYYYISTFIGEHIAHHANFLKA